VSHSAFCKDVVYPARVRTCGPSGQCTPPLSVLTIHGRAVGPVSFSYNSYVVLGELTEGTRRLINPNTVGAHLHQVVGGVCHRYSNSTTCVPIDFLFQSSFDFNMPSTVDLQASTCSSCSILENKSNYWTPTLYFKSPQNGSFIRVPQTYGPYTGDNSGNPNQGMVVYYNNFSPTRGFPKVNRFELSLCRQLNTHAGLPHGRR
jgi:hypothetical protein